MTVDLRHLRVPAAAGRLVVIRLLFLLGASFTLLWQPISTRDLPRRDSVGAVGDLILRTFDHWDSIWFVRIAEHGYASDQAAAFFPVYPLVVRGVAFVVRSELAAGMLVSLAAAAAAAVLLERIAHRHLSEEAARTSVLLLALYPIAFVFTAVYSDALFLLFVVAAVDAAECRRPVLAWLCAALAVDTRLLGVALVPTLAIILWPRGARLREVARLAPAVLVPGALALWLVYLNAHYGDPLQFSHAERIYWERQAGSAHAIGSELRSFESGLANILVHLPPALGYPTHYPVFVVRSAEQVLDAAAFVAALVLSWAAWRRLGAAFGVYSLATLAMVAAAPAVNEPLMSLTRFLLADFPLFLVLAAFAEQRPRVREALLVGFAALGAVAAAGFAHGTWIA
jgi:hypothetical protein